MKVDASKVNLTEKDIEDYLWEYPHVVSNGEWGVIRWIKRQYKVPSGIIDLLGFSNDGRLIVVEVKNVDVDARAVAQVSRYTFDIYQIIEHVQILEDEKEDGDKSEEIIYVGVRRVIVGPSITDTVFRECEACGVVFMKFAVTFSVNVSETGWTSQFRASREEEYETLADDGDWTSTLKESQKLMDSPEEWIPF